MRCALMAIFIYGVHVLPGVWDIHQETITLTLVAKTFLSWKEGTFHPGVGLGLA